MNDTDEQTFSFIPSRRQIETVAIRDDGQEATDEDEAIETAIVALRAYQDAKDALADNVDELRTAAEAATQHPLGTEYRRGWPVGSAVLVKASPSAGDTADATHLTVKGRLNLANRGGTISTSNEPELNWYLGGLLACSVMVVRFVGDAFRDPDTGDVLSLPPLPTDNETNQTRRSEMYLKRVEKLRLIPQPVINYVIRELQQMGDDPLAVLTRERIIVGASPLRSVTNSVEKPEPAGWPTAATPAS